MQLMYVQGAIENFVFPDKSGLFFGHLEKNSSPKKLKTQAKSRKNSSKISNKLKNRQLNLSSIAVQVSKPLIFLGCLGSERI